MSILLTCMCGTCIPGTLGSQKEPRSFARTSALNDPVILLPPKLFLNIREAWNFFGKQFYLSTPGKLFLGFSFLLHPLSFPLSLEYYRAFFTQARMSSPNSDNAISAWYSSYAATHTHPFESPLSSPFLACQACRSAEAATSKQTQHTA